MRNISKALGSGSEDFAIWVAVHWQDLCEKESDLRQVRSIVCDLRDWVRAGISQGITAADVSTICRIVQNNEVATGLEEWWESVTDLAEIGRPFNKEMSVQTVLKLSGEWHERQAETEAADVEFSQEWYEGSSVGDFKIEPVRTAAELSRYAYRLRNCATSYAHQIANEDCFFYAVFEGDDLKAMLEIDHGGRGINVSQLQGPQNSAVSVELKAAVDSWRKTCKPPAKSELVEASAN